jgi:hypothetical protein
LGNKIFGELAWTIQEKVLIIFAGFKHFHHFLVFVCPNFSLLAGLISR